MNELIKTNCTLLNFQIYYKWIWREKNWIIEIRKNASFTSEYKNLIQFQHNMGELYRSNAYY